MEDQTSIEQPQGETDEQAAAEPETTTEQEQATEVQAGSPAADVPDGSAPYPIQADSPAAAEDATPAQSVEGDPVSGDGEPDTGIDFPLLKYEVLALAKRIFGEMATLEHEASGLVIRVAGDVKHVVRLL